MTQRVQWAHDLVRLEIVLWDHVDSRLKEAHGLSLASFETLWVLKDREMARVGDLARELRITMGGASKLADRVRATGLIERAVDPADRRATQIALTAEGRAMLAAATATYDAAMAELLDGVISDDELSVTQDVITRLLRDPAR
ncbi:MarR family winged helix-turn-helix transcriptional regulator [Paractinoplanes atraurantiacus]|uniref:MarR family winged helix-turn-helix transcriptional regulator n=1 Tax=Paractinoplanes atraurantiacus TaxID=1036182 RepID=UPI0015CF0034|nr:MarR family winged helix-turn-helix transcriptional regulator [Actinoplanes atraurantiacus]